MIALHDAICNQFYRVSLDVFSSFHNGYRFKYKAGIKLLVQRCRKQFRISENLEHYSESDYREAERKYVKLCLRSEIKK